jgi:L-threonylcarbamoyladenylate synthase
MGQILQATDHNLNLCKQALRNSKVIAVPTETVYGLAGNALDEVALEAIFKIKGRPLFNPLILHTDCLENAEKFATFNSLARQLAERLWPGPLTIILPKKAIVPNLVTANLDSVAIRCPQHPIFLKLLRILPFPLAAPSANPFGYVSPTSAEHVNNSLGDKLAFILDGADSEIGIESTIVDLRNSDEPKILRPGPISKEILEAKTHIEFKEPQTAQVSELRAPGMLKSHYSPKTSLEITSLDQLNGLIASDQGSRCAFIFQKRPKESIYPKSSCIYWLSENGSAKEIARNIYRVLRVTDALNYEKIYIEAISDTEGLSVALKDRLSKAASK